MRYGAQDLNAVSLSGRIRRAKEDCVQPDELVFMPATDLAGPIRRKRVSPIEVVARWAGERPAI
jgi:hypothetical protein